MGGAGVRWVRRGVGGGKYQINMCGKKPFDLRYRTKTLLK
jgi:hypothetical protein